MSAHPTPAPRRAALPLTDPRSTGSGPRPRLGDVAGLRGAKPA